MRIKNNYTKYNTEDLQSLLDLFDYAKEISIRYLAKDKNEKLAIDDENDNAFVRLPWGRESLYLASPGLATKKLGIVALATPDSVSPQFVSAIVKCLSRQIRCADIQRAATRTIRIDSRRAKGQGVAKPKATAEQQLQRMRDMYGIGRLMPGGRKKVSYLWSSKISDAHYYYGQEFAARDAWRIKLEAKGHKLEPVEVHETFPEYLRRIADELEKKKPCSK